MELINDLLKDCHSNDITKQVQAIMKLQDFKAYEAVPTFLKLLTSPEWNIRMLVVESLGLLGEKKIDKVGFALIKMLTDPEELVRSQAVDSLAILRYAPAIEPIINLLHNDRDWVVRASAAEALADLAEVGDSKVLTELELAMNDMVEPVRSYAACSIGLIGTPELLPKLQVYLMSEPCLDTKAELLAARYRLGGQNDLSRLLELLDNADNRLLSVILNILTDLAKRKVPQSLVADAFHIRESLTKVTQTFPSHLNHVRQIVSLLEKLEK